MEHLVQLNRIPEILLVLSGLCREKYLKLPVTGCCCPKDKQPRVSLVSLVNFVVCAVVSITFSATLMSGAFPPKTKVFYVHLTVHYEEQAGHTAACPSKHTVQQMDNTFLGVNPADDLVWSPNATYGSKFLF